jgi:WD40-like Beta Propeller Repeat
MSKFLNIIRPLFLSTAFISGATAQYTQPVSAPLHDDAVNMASPDGRYLVRFSTARSDGKEAGKLWGTITVRDLHTRQERTARVAAGKRGAGVFEGFSLYEGSAAWSPDGLYVAYYQDACIDEPGVGGGVVCHLHEIRFLRMRRQTLCPDDLALDRYGFGGWVRGRAHTLWEIDAEGRRVKRTLCARGR